MEMNNNATNYVQILTIVSSDLVIQTMSYLHGHNKVTSSCNY